MEYGKSRRVRRSDARDSRATEGEGDGIRGGGQRGDGGGGGGGSGGGGGDSGSGGGGGEKGWGVEKSGEGVGERKGEGEGDLLAAGIGIRSASTTRRECVRYYETEETEKDVTAYAQKREMP